MKTNENESDIPDWANALITSNDDDQQEQTTQHDELSAERKRKLHNRTCTIKQRRRYYRHELIFEDIDRHFTIKQIKMILKQQQISVYVVNTTISKTTNKKKLFVAVRNPESIKIYGEQSRGYFTTQHFNELRANGRLPQTNRKNSHHQHRSRPNPHQQHRFHWNLHEEHGSYER
jgi:hypothetical protein